jgi:hypothetical protein
MKIFRKIRRSLLLSGKNRSYIIYALGEIVLIVIGILIAWKINNLNELRKNKIVQVKIYESLYEELNTNIDLLDTAIIRYNEHVVSIQNTLNYVGVNEENLSQQGKDSIIQITFRNTNLRDEALSSVNITDKFQFIENLSLNELIAQYPSDLKSFEDQELKIRTIIQNRLKPVLEQHISLVDMLPDEGYKQIKTNGKPSDYSKLLNNRDYQNSVIDRLLQTQIQLNISIDLRDKTETLHNMLKHELGYG